MSDELQFNLVLLRFFQAHPIYSCMLEFVNISLREFHYSISESDYDGKIGKKAAMHLFTFFSPTKTFRTWMFVALEKAFLNFKLNTLSSPSDVPSHSSSPSWISIHVSCKCFTFFAIFHRIKSLCHKWKFNFYASISPSSFFVFCDENKRHKCDNQRRERREIHECIKDLIN